MTATAPSPTRLAWRRFSTNRLAVLGLALVVLVTLVALLAPLIERYPDTQLGFTPLEGPSSEHWFGTDDLGRDLWSRVVNGARLSLIVGVGSQVIALTIGTIVGVIAGYRGGLVDATLMRLTDIALAIPAVLLALLFLAIFGASTLVMMVAIGLGTWPVSARLARAEVLQIREEHYVEAARLLGLSQARVMTRHVLRGALGPLLVLGTFGIPQAITSEALLSFIGLGPPPPNPSWGRLLADSFSYLQISPHYVLFPAAAMSLTLLAFNFAGDGTRDLVDTRSLR